MSDFSNSALYKIESQSVHFAQTPSGISLRAEDFVVLGRIFSNANSLSLDAGNNTGSIISIDQLRGDGGSLTIINSAGVTISQVGKLSIVSGSSTETFGTISILDSINDIVFNSVSTICYFFKHHIIFLSLVEC